MANPLNVWSEDFSSTPGTLMTELGFTSLTNRGLAYVSDTGTLALATTATSNNKLYDTEAMASVNWVVANGGSFSGKSSQIMPDGSTNGQKFSFEALTVWHGFDQVSKGQAIARATPYTLSCWVSCETGEEKFRFIARDVSNNIIISSPDITVTTTPTRYSFTFQFTGTGTIGNARFGFINATDKAARELVFWGAQLERFNRMTPYRGNAASGGSETTALWTKDIGSLDQEMECDVFKTAAEYVLMAFRVSAWNNFLGVLFTSTSASSANIILRVGSNTSGGVGISFNENITLPVRIKIRIYNNKLYAFKGPVGSSPTTQIGNLDGYDLTTLFTTLQPSTLSGFGYKTTNTDTVIVDVADNYVANKIIVVNGVESRSETTSEPAMVLPASDNHNVPNWVDSFGSSKGEITNIGFTKHISAGILTDANGRLGRVAQVFNHAYESNDPMDDSWILMNSATKDGYSSAVLFPYAQKGVKFNFGSNPDGQVRVNTNESSGYIGSSNTDKVFSVWLATESGETTVRIGTANHTNTLYGLNEVTVTTTPQRFYATINSPFTNFFSSGSSRSINIRGIVANNVSGTSQPVVAWGAQIENGTTPREFYANGTKRIPSVIYTKPVSSPRQYVEFDVLGSVSNLLPNYILAALRVVDCDRFVGIYYSNGSFYTYVPGRSDTLICSYVSTTGNLRVRFEIFNNRIQVFTGPTNARDPQVVIGEIFLPEDLYDGFSTATLTGMGIKTISRSTSNDFNGLAATSFADNYESGGNIGPDRHWVTPVDAVSSTRSDVVLPVDLVWVESFDEPEGTALFDMGFTFETTEINGNPRTAVVGSSNRLTLLSSSLSAAIWVKDTLTHNHFIEAEIYSYPSVTMEAPIIMRAAGPEFWIGMWFDGNAMVFGYRYASSIIEYFRQVRTSYNLPFKIRMEAKGHYVYAYRTSSISSTNWSSFGSSEGYFIDENATPALMISNRTGVGRANGTAALNIADNLRAGIAQIAGSRITDANRPNYSTTKGGKFQINGTVEAQGIKAVSLTYERPNEEGIFFEQFVNADETRSETSSDIARSNADPISYTRSDQALVTVDKIVISKAVSATVSDSWHQPSEVSPSGARSESVSEAGSMTFRTVIYELEDDNYPPNLRPPRIRESRSETKSPKSPVNGWAIIDPPKAWNGNKIIQRSETRSDRGSTIPERFPEGIKATSITFGDATVATVRFLIDPIKGKSETRADGPDPGTKDPYRPWLFT